MSYDTETVRAVLTAVQKQLSERRIGPVSLSKVAHDFGVHDFGTPDVVRASGWYGGQE
jgi:hypothetical protein